MKGTSNKIRYMNKGTFQYVVSFLYDKYFSSLGLMTRRLYHTERSICWIKQPWLRHNRHRARRTKVWVLMRIRCGRSSHRDGHQTTPSQRPARGRKRPRRAEGGGEHEGDGTPGSCAGCRGGAHANALLGTLWMGGWGEVLLASDSSNHDMADGGKGGHAGSRTAEQLSVNFMRSAPLKTKPTLIGHGS